MQREEGFYAVLYMVSSPDILPNLSKKKKKRDRTFLGSGKAHKFEGWKGKNSMQRQVSILRAHA